jgi:hypothetical protein
MGVLVINCNGVLTNLRSHNTPGYVGNGSITFPFTLIIMMKYIILCHITTIGGEMLFNIEINLICRGMK